MQGPDSRQLTIIERFDRLMAMAVTKKYWCVLNAEYKTAVAAVTDART